jgi:hypothetical protein
MLMTLGSSSIVFIDAPDMICRKMLVGKGVLQAAGFASSSASVFLFLSIYSMVKPLIFFHSSDWGQVFFEGRLSGDAFFFYLSGYYLRVCVKNAPLNTNGR